MNYKYKNSNKSPYNSLILRKGEGIRFHNSHSKTDLEKFSGLVALSELRKGTLCTENVYKRILLDPDILETAYNKISKNMGALTPGTDKITLDGTSRKSLEKISLELKSHAYEFKPARREYIPKANGKLRPLGIPSPRDKIVQQAMVMILEAVFEKHFLESSHGFRPNKGCHTALKQVSRWSGVSWFIEGDIKSYFDTIDHHILANFIKTKIHDQQFLELYWKAVRAGYVESKSGKKIDSTVGTPQGSIVSPILANIYLHRLDLLMNKIRTESQQSGKTSKPNKRYIKLHSRAHTLYKRMRRTENHNQKDKEELRKVIAERGKLPSTVRAEGYRVYYVRYADDFLVGITGTRAKANQIRQTIGNFLEKELKLTMSEDKTKLTEATNKLSKAHFLGTEIYRNQSRTYDQKSVRKYYAAKERKFVGRIGNSKISLLIPIRRVVIRLEEQNMCRIDDWNQGKIVPTAKTAWINLEPQKIVDKYNMVLLGYRNFYSFADNRNRMQLIQFIIQHSCAKTLGRKLSLKTRALVFKKYGTRLAVTKGDKALKLLKSHKRTGVFKVNPPDPLEAVYYSLRSNSPLNKSCFICDSTEDIEIHHIRKLQGKTRGNMIDVMKALNRKQIPVCHTCITNIHRGIYDGVSLKKLLSQKGHEVNMK